MRNIASLLSTSSQVASETALTTVTSTKGKLYQITGFDGCSNDQSFKVELKFGSTVKLIMQGSADTTVGRDFGDNGPVTGVDESVTVLTTPAATGQCTANLIYKVIF